MVKFPDIQNDVIHFWLDHLEIFATSKHEKELFDILDFDNSNYWELEDYTFTKNEVPKYEYKILFTKDNYSLFAYYKWKPKSKKQPVATRDYLVVYWTAFKILSIDEIQYFMEWYFELFHARRFDICMDLKKDITQTLKCFNDFKTWREYKKQWRTETRYIWELKKSNKRQIIRIYDKLLDIRAKQKLKLFFWYFDYKDTWVTRIELEVRQELAKNVPYYALFHNQSVLYGIFKNYLCKHTKILNKIDVEKISLYKEPEKIDAEKFQSLYYVTQQVNHFLWHARTIQEMWFCPTRVIIWAWYTSLWTQLIIWQDRYENILAREKKVITQAKESKYIRKNWYKVLDNYYKYGKIWEYE